MPENNSLEALFQSNVTKTKGQFISEYLRLKEVEENNEEASTIFKSDLENAIGAIYDTLDINKDGTVDDSEIQKLSQFDTSDGENVISESDISALYEKTIRELTSNIELDSPENMYNKAMADDSVDPAVVGYRKGDFYISELSNRINILNELIISKQLQSDSKIMRFRNELDSLILRESDLSNEEKNAYSVNSQKLRSKEAELREKEKDYNQKHSELKVAENEITYLQKIKSDDNTQQKLNYWQGKYSTLSQECEGLVSDIKSLKSDISDITKEQKTLADKANFKRSELNSEKTRLQNAIDQEQKDCKAYIDNCRQQIDAFEASRVYASEQVAPDAVIQDYSDSDTVKFDGNAQDLKRIWSSVNPNLSDGFYQKVIEVSNRIGCDANDLMAMMRSESGISSTAVNKNGGATGLIQFMPKTAQLLGTSTAALYRMSPEQQLVYVEKYYNMTKKMGGFAANEKLNAGQLYALTFLPAYAKREVLTVKGHKYYDYNKGLDVNKDGQITISDLSQRVENMKPKSIRNKKT